MKNLGLLAIGSFWILAAFMVVAAKRDHGITISEHVAKSRSSKLIFGASQILIILVFGAFLSKWFIPHFHLGKAYAVLVITGVLSVVVAALIPRTANGLSRKIHDFAAYLMALTILLDSILLATSHYVSTAVRGVVIATILGMMTIAVVFGVGLYRRKSMQKLGLQVGYYALFHVGILVATYGVR